MDENKTSSQTKRRKRNENAEIKSIIVNVSPTVKKECKGDIDVPDLLFFYNLAKV